MRLPEFMPRGKGFPEILYVHGIADGKPHFYMNEERDYLYDLAGRSVGYIDDGTVYTTDGRPWFTLRDGYFFDGADDQHLLPRLVQARAAEAFQVMFPIGVQLDRHLLCNPGE